MELPINTEQSKWERLAAVVDSGAADNVLPAGVCSHEKLSATRRSEAGIGFSWSGRRVNPQPRSEEIQGSRDRRAGGGKHMAGGGCEETAHASGQDGHSRESCASRQQGS